MRIARPTAALPWVWLVHDLADGVVVSQQRIVCRNVGRRPQVGRCERNAVEAQQVWRQARTDFLSHPDDELAAIALCVPSDSFDFTDL
jgi:hypothetical protein